MTKAEWTDKLIEEGFGGIHVQKDKKNVRYPAHGHPFISAHVILEGSMTLAVDGEIIRLNVGDRYNVPKEVVHVVQIGSEGCTYLIGEK